MIEQILEQLAEIRAQIDLLNVDKKTAIDSIITDEQRAAIRDIEFEFGEKLESAQANASELESKVKALVQWTDTPLTILSCTHFVTKVSHRYQFE